MAQCSAIQCIVQYSAVKCNAVQYSALQCSTMHQNPKCLQEQMSHLSQEIYTLFKNSLFRAKSMSRHFQIRRNYYHGLIYSFI